MKNENSVDKDSMMALWIISGLLVYAYMPISTIVFVRLKVAPSITLTSFLLTLYVFIGICMRYGYAFETKNNLSSFKSYLVYYLYSISIWWHMPKRYRE